MLAASAQLRCQLPFHHCSPGLHRTVGLPSWPPLPWAGASKFARGSMGRRITGALSVGREWHSREEGDEREAAAQAAHRCASDDSDEIMHVGNKKESMDQVIGGERDPHTSRIDYLSLLPLTLLCMSACVRLSPLLVASPSWRRREAASVEPSSHFRVRRHPPTDRPPTDHQRMRDEDHRPPARRGCHARAATAATRTGA